MTNTTASARQRYGSCKAEHVGSFLRSLKSKVLVPVSKPALCRIVL